MASSHTATPGFWRRDHDHPIPRWTWTQDRLPTQPQFGGPATEGPMSDKTFSALILLFVCCGWPVIVHIAWTYALTWLIKTARRVDWKNIQWPWSKDND